jgi:hypothetical protein
MNEPVMSVGEDAPAVPGEEEVPNEEKVDNEEGEKYTGGEIPQVSPSEQNEN